MSTRRLARTVLEGGRLRANQFERRHANRRHRAAERVYVRRLQTDPESFQTLAPPKPPWIPKYFYDKLGAVERWLCTQVGRPWDDVRSEIAARFDTRSLAGRHIVFDHLLPNPRWGCSLRDGWAVHRRGVFHVDDEGILRFTSSPQPRRPRPTPPELVDAALAWAGAWRVGMVDTTPFWFQPTRTDDARLPTRWRQHVTLTPQERAFYEALGPSERDAITLLREPSEDDAGGAWASPR